MTDFDQTISAINEAIYTLGENVIAVFGYMFLFVFYLCALIYGIVNKIVKELVKI